MRVEILGFPVEIDEDPDSDLIKDADIKFGDLTDLAKSLDEYGSLLAKGLVDEYGRLLDEQGRLVIEDDEE